jgi:hypothetical protein
LTINDLNVSFILVLTLKTCIFDWMRYGHMSYTATQQERDYRRGKERGRS